MNVFNASTVLAETAPTGGAGGLAGLLPFVLIGAAFYFLIIRPQRKRQAEQSAMLRRISEGDEVVTIGGFHGTVVALADDTMELELAPGVVVTMARTAISRALTEPAPLLDEFDDDDDDFDDDEFGNDEFGDDAIDVETDLGDSQADSSDDR